MQTRNEDSIMSEDNISTGTRWSIAVSHRFRLHFVWCPPGTGVVGSPTGSGRSLEEPQQQLRLTKGFWIAQTPVTELECKEVIGSPLRLDRESSEECGMLPVEGITWDAARNFCLQLMSLLKKTGSIRDEWTVDLPTEAEWEYACRAGTTSEWFFGSQPSCLEDCAWYLPNSGGHTHTVASKRPNPWGIYDQYGNVAEWCLDEFRRYDDREISDPLVFNEGGLMKIVRGGGYTSTADECRSATRAFCHRSNPDREPIGLRPVIRKKTNP